jgi:hypothetical protein
MLVSANMSKAALTMSAFDPSRARLNGPFGPKLAGHTWLWILAQQAAISLNGREHGDFQFRLSGRED